MFIRPSMLALLLALPGVGCVSDAPRPGGGIDWVSRPRSERITHIVVHHTSSDLSQSVAILSGRDPARRVSSNYLITDEVPARILALVPEDRVAFHAGVSGWRGRSGLNDCSVGIEIVNPDGNLHPYSESQATAVGDLLESLVRRHGIEARNIVGHAEVSPGRKVDPGSLFPWERLHRQRGLGTWPRGDLLQAELARGVPLPSPEESRALLRRWGYPLALGSGKATGERDALAAFQRRYRPARVDGAMDGETAAILRALLATFPDTP